MNDLAVYMDGREVSVDIAEGYGCYVCTLVVSSMTTKVKQFTASHWHILHTLRHWYRLVLVSCDCHSINKLQN